MPGQIQEDASLARQALLLSRPNAHRVLQLVAWYVGAAIPDAEERLGTSLGVTVMSPVLLERGQRRSPDLPKHALVTVNIAMSYLVTVRDLPEPSFHFLVLESALADHAIEQLSWQGFEVGLEPTDLKPPAKWELWLKGLDAAEAGLKVEPLRQAIAELAAPYLGRRLFNKSWHDPHAAHLFIEALHETTGIN